MSSAPPAHRRPGSPDIDRMINARHPFPASVAFTTIICAALLIAISAMYTTRLQPERAFAGSHSIEDFRDLGSAAASASSAEVASSLVINEVDYDQPGSDTLEFVEIYNAGGDPVGLDGVSVLGINGDGTEYKRIALPDVSLLAGDWYVVGSAGVPNVDHVGGTTNIFQNGAPDAIAIMFTATGDPDDELLVDSVSYEGETTGGPPNGGSWTEGAGGAPADNGVDADVAIARYPDGTDTDVNADDFAARCATPGESNVPGATCDAGDTPTATDIPSSTPTQLSTPDATPTPEDIGGLAVELVDLRAVRRTDGTVVVTWRTLSEIDHAGFRLLRESTIDRPVGESIAIGGLIPARGDAFAGADYHALDSAAPADGIRYWLEDVDTLGRATPHGPLDVGAMEAGVRSRRYENCYGLGLPRGWAARWGWAARCGLAPIGRSEFLRPTGLSPRRMR